MDNMYFPSIDMVGTGHRIRHYCECNNIKVKDLQKLLGFNHPQAIYNWLSGKTLPSIDNLLVLSTMFHVSINDILAQSDKGFCF